MGPERWEMPPVGLTCSRDEVHLWRASLEVPEACLLELERMLSADERMRAERFRLERDRRHFVVGRGLLRRLLGSYLDVAPGCLQFRYGPWGKPLLAETYAEIRFNLSHSHGLAIYGISRGHEIGVDVERLRPIAEAEQIAGRFFSASETVVLRGLPESEKVEGFFRCWTAKEAYLKAVGDGLARPLAHVDVSLAPREVPRLKSIDGDVREASRWSLRTLRLASGYIAALCVEGAPEARLFQMGTCSPPPAGCARSRPCRSPFRP